MIEGLLGESTAGVVALLAFLFLTVYAMWQRWTARSSSRSDHKGRVFLPTPRRLLPNWCGLLSGHMLLVRRKKFVQQLEEWADEFQGDYELRIMGKRVIVVTNAEEIRRMLALRPAKFLRGLSPTHMHWPAGEMGLVPSIFFDEGKVWGRSRRIIAPSLNPHNVVDMLPAMVTIAERLCAKWKECAKTGKIVDAKDNFMRYTHDVLCSAALGTEANSLVAKDGERPLSFDAVCNMTANVLRLSFDPLSKLGWIWFPSLLPWARKARESAAMLDTAAMNAINKTRLQIADESRNGVTEASTDARMPSSFSAGKILRKIVSLASNNAGGNAGDTVERMTLTDEQVLKQLKIIFLAGTDTTALSLAWTLYYLAKHPEAHARCRKEALQVAPDTNGMIMSKEQLLQLVFCSAVFKESFRLHPSVTVLFFHNAAEYKMKNGLEAEKGTGFITLLRYPASSEEAFTRPDEFIPERWIAAERDAALLSSEDLAYGKQEVHHCEETLGFGNGPRKCPGQEMAKSEAMLLLAAICARFNLALAPEQDDPPQEILSFVSGPEDVKLVLTEA